MFKIDSPGSVGSPPVPAALGTEGYFFEGDPAIGQAATRVSADWLNMVQETLRTPLAAAGIADSKTNYAQLYHAMLRGQTFLDAGAPNAIAIFPPVTLPVAIWAAGLRFTILVGYTNTSSNVTLSINGQAAYTLFGPAGTPTQPRVGDLQAGNYYEVVWDGAAWRLTGAVIGDITSLLGTAIGGLAVFTTPGVTSWVIQSPIFDVVVIGGGGAGGASGDGSAGGVAGNGGAGGHGGGYARKRQTGMTVGLTSSVIVGAGGVAAFGAIGGNGGASSWGGTVSASGGGGGLWGANTYNIFGSPGSGSGGDINILGSYGGPTGPNDNALYSANYLYNLACRGGMAAGGFSLLRNYTSGNGGLGFGTGGDGATGGVNTVPVGGGASGAVIITWG